MQVAFIGEVRRRQRMRDRPSRADLLDLGIPVALALLAALAMLMPAGSGARLALALTMLFFVPGHLLIAAFTRVPTSRGQRPMRALAALGVSPPLVGILALATTLLPGGFRPTAIVIVITIACLALAAVALFRRSKPAAAASPLRSTTESGDPGDSSAV